MNVNFHETISFFSPNQPHLQGERKHGEKDELAIPLHVLPYFFDVDRHGKQGKIKQVVTHKEKESMTTTQKKA